MMDWLGRGVLPPAFLFCTGNGGKHDCVACNNHVTQRTASVVAFHVSSASLMGKGYCWA